MAKKPKPGPKGPRKKPSPKNIMPSWPSGLILSTSSRDCPLARMLDEALDREIDKLIADHDLNLQKRFTVLEAEDLLRGPH